MSPGNSANPCPAAVKAELVLRLLRGESLADLARQTGRPRKQLIAWQRRFLAGGEAYLEDRAGHRDLEGLRAAHQQLSAKVARLEAENRELERHAQLLATSRSARATPHPNCSAAYSRVFEEPGVQPLHVREWATHVLVREGRGGTRQATGVRPYASLAPDSSLRAGLDTLGQAGVASVSLITDPLWCPELHVLQRAFTVCRPFKRNYFVDRAAGDVQIRKRHRNMINRARRAGEVCDISLAEHLGRWLELYGRNVDARQIPQPFRPTYFERLSGIGGLRTVAVLMRSEIVTMTLWIRYQDILYFYDGASSDTGLMASASYAAFAHVVEEATDCRYVFLGGSADFRDDDQDGLAVFKRGFSNSSALSYLCSTTLNRAGTRSA